MSMLWFAFAVDMDALRTKAADRLAPLKKPGEVRELFEELVRDLGEPLEDEGVEGGVLEEVLGEQDPQIEAMRPGLPEPFLSRAGRGFRSEIGFLNAGDLPALRARLQPSGDPDEAGDAEDYALRAYAQWVSQAATQGRSLVFLWE